MKLRQRSVRFTAAAATAIGIIVAGISDTEAHRMIQTTDTGRVTSSDAVVCSDPGGFAHWTNGATINWFHNTAGQGADMGAALQAALDSWVDVPNADHVPTYAGQTQAGWATDQQNTILWAQGNGCTDTCLALTALVLQNGQVIVESDVTFNAAYTWRTDGTDYDTEAIAAHEFGHSMGIHHTELTSTPRPTMRTPYFGVDGRSLEADDQAALQCADGRMPTMTQGQAWVSGGFFLAKGYSVNTFGSLSLATTVNGRTHASFADWYWGGQTYSFSVFSVQGFTSDPGQAWLDSVTALGVTRTGVGAASYSYPGDGSATWSWTDGPFGFTGSGTTGVTIVHAP